MKPIKLVLGGSGTKFPIYAGAVLALEEAGLIPEEVVGTSGGSVIAAAIATGYTGSMLVKLCKDVMPRLAKLTSFSIFKFFDQWGFEKGEKLKQELGAHLVDTLGEARIPLHIITTNFDTEEEQIYSSTTHPGLATERAVRASISIPIVFVPEIINGDMHIDGGVKRNFAIDFFEGDPSNVVGLCFLDKPGRRLRPKGMFAIVKFIARVIGMLINAKTEDDIQDADNAKVCFLSSDVDGLDFSFTPQEVDKMINEGYNQTKEWLAKNPQILK